MNITDNRKNNKKWVPFNEVPIGAVYKTSDCVEQEYMMRIWPDHILFLNTGRSLSEEYSRKTNPLCLLLDHELVIKGEL